MGDFKIKIKGGENKYNLNRKRGLKKAIDGFWVGLEKRSSENHKKEPIYYGTELPGSFFPDDLNIWNLNKFTAKESLIHTLPKKDWLVGIHTPLLYVGMNYSSFGLHTEDRNLGAINYNHWGAPKIWYGINRKYEKDIPKLVNGCIKNNDCDNLTYHKGLLVSPIVLKNANIEYKVVKYFLLLLFQTVFKRRRFYFS